MTFYFVKWREGKYESWDVGGFEIAGSVERTGKAIHWIEQAYKEALREQRHHKPYIIEGRKISFDFLETIIAREK